MALRAHFDNPHVQAHIGRLQAGILSSPTDIVIYADWDDAQNTYWRNAFGDVNLQFADLKTGFFLHR